MTTEDWGSKAWLGLNGNLDDSDRVQTVLVTQARHSGLGFFVQLCQELILVLAFTG